MLRFATAGIPNVFKKGGYVKAIPRMRDELGISAMEVEFVRGARMRPELAAEIGALAKEHDVALTVHGPYYINLNAVDPEKRVNSRKHITDSARLGSLMGARSVTFHAAFFLKMDGETVYRSVKSEMELIRAELADEGITIQLKPELTGKPTQWGSLEELLRLSKDLPGVEPCIDFAHNHARYGGGRNSYQDFAHVFDEIRNTLGAEALKNMHMHVSGIEYTAKGERKHLVFTEADFAYKDFLRVLLDYEIEGVLVCESPSIEEDTILLSNLYKEMSKA